MKIATTTGDFSDVCTNDIEKIRELYRAGFRYIDLSMYSFTPDCVYMRDGWQDEVKKLKEEAEKLGMTFVQAHSQGGNPLAEDPMHVKFLLDATVRSIEICEILGIKNTVVHNGLKEGLSKEQWFEENRGFYSRLFPAMERCGVNVLCENSTKSNTGELYFINCGRDMVEFIDFVSHPMIHACWDTGHGNCEGSQYDDIMALGKELYAIHYNDNKGRMDEHVAPFMGTLNHDEILTALKDVGFGGYFTLECSNSLVISGYRRKFGDKTALSAPQLFMQRHIESLMYETSEWMLREYGMFEE